MAGLLASSAQVRAQIVPYRCRSILVADWLLRWLLGTRTAALFCVKVPTIPLAVGDRIAIYSWPIHLARAARRLPRLQYALMQKQFLLQEVVTVQPFIKSRPSPRLSFFGSELDSVWLFQRAHLEIDFKNIHPSDPCSKRKNPTPSLRISDP